MSVCVKERERQKERGVTLGGSGGNAIVGPALCPLLGERAAGEAASLCALCPKPFPSAPPLPPMLGVLVGNDFPVPAFDRAPPEAWGFQWGSRQIEVRVKSGLSLRPAPAVEVAGWKRFPRARVRSRPPRSLGISVGFNLGSSQV